MDQVAASLNNLCFQSENSYFEDNDITCILHKGITPENIIIAARKIRDKEKSMFLKLPVKFLSQAKAQPQVSIEDLSQIAKAAYSGEETKVTIESIEMAEKEDIILKVLGPFSTLLERVGSNTLFRWLYKDKNELHFALTEITEALAAYINSALDKGVKIISLAEPSAMVEVIGEKCYREFVISYIVKLLQKIEASLDKSLLHLCPRTSYQLERYGVMTKEELSCCGKSYAQALIEFSQKSNIRFIGHRCINNEHVKVWKIHVLRLL